MTSDNSDKINDASRLFNNGYKCSQSVFTAFLSDSELPKETALRISKFLGSGFIYRGEMCGAVSGALMYYSLKFSSVFPENNITDDIFYSLCQNHVKAFEEKFGSLSCKDLIGYHLGNFEESQKAKDSGVPDRCPEFVEFSAQLLASAISFIEGKKQKYPHLFDQ